MNFLRDKMELRAQLRAARKAHVAGLPVATRALVLRRPPALLAGKVPEGATVGLYHAVSDEAPALGYARWFHENGRAVALPWFADRDAAMQFRLWQDPWAEDGLEPGPWGALQPSPDAAEAVPAFVIVPLLGFTADGQRIGQGGGHYDRWLAANPAVPAFGLGWDCQLCDSLPMEPHDRPLAAVITPTRLYGEID